MRARCILKKIAIIIMIFSAFMPIVNAEGIMNSTDIKTSNQSKINFLDQDDTIDFTNKKKNIDIDIIYFKTYKTN